MTPDLWTIFSFLAQAEIDDIIPRCDAIFVFGTTTGDVARHAAHLYQQGKASRVIFSGKHRHDKTGGPFGFSSEAEYLASIAEQEGVPSKDIILETKALNTYENVIFGVDVLRGEGLDIKTLVITAVPYLLRRARACFAKNFPNIKIYASAMPVEEEFFTPYRIERIKGELPRLVKYAALGTIAAVVIPEGVLRAASSLDDTT